MAVEAIQGVHTSPVAQSIEAVENALRNPSPQQRQTSALPQDKVTISAAAQAKQPASTGNKNPGRSGK